jgi:single-strand DNA-binding protein
MAGSVNKQILLGNLGKDPELREVGSKKKCGFSMATSETWKDKDGNKQEKTTWHNIVAWDKKAEILHQYLKKGDRVYIEGHTDNRSYEKDGATKYITEVVVDDFTLLGNRGEGGGNKEKDEGGGGNKGGSNKGGSSNGDDLPF